MTHHSAAISPTYMDSALTAVRSSWTLALIDTVNIMRIVKRDGHHRYVVSVYVHSARRKLPLMLISPTELYFRTRLPHVSDSDNSHRGEPDYEVEHRFDDFIKLRDALHEIASAAHSSDKDDHIVCSFCSALHELVSRDKRRPRKSLQLFATSSQRMVLLSTFVCCVVAMVTHATQHSHPVDCCSAALQAADLLEDFLRKPRDSSLGII